MKKKTLQTIRKHNLIKKGMHIVIGLSGGPDSVCLFDVLNSLKDEWDLTLYAVHINHKLREGAAEEDQHYVEELCAKLNIPCEVFIRDCNVIAAQEGMTSEEAGRKVRYEAFSQVALKIHQNGIPKNKVAIALAHNANDQCETILFRLMRGTGTDGLSGIPYERFEENGFAVIRPILDIGREEIEKYCKDRELNPRIDHTNNENIYARNKIRNLLIPFIEENFNENIIETVNRLGRIAAGDRDYMSIQTQKAYEEALIDDANMLECDRSKIIKQALDTKVLLTLHNAVRFRVYTTALEKLGMEQNITFAQGELIDKVLESKSPSAMCDLSDGFVVLKEYDKLVFRQRSTNSDNSKREYQILTMTKAEFDKFRQTYGNAQASNIVYGAFQGVEEKEVCIRTRKPGDVINTGNGTKKIQDFFVDQKVPKHSRDDMKLLAKGSQVLWVLPSEEFPSEILRKKGRFSADYRVEDGSADILLVLEKL